MLCPKCVHEMETVSVEGIEINRCAHCFGIWFDRLEKEDLRKLKGAESVDVGDEFVGARYDQIQQIDCPKCGTPALHVNVQEPTIRLRSVRPAAARSSTRASSGTTSRKRLSSSSRRC